MVVVLVLSSWAVFFPQAWRARRTVAGLSMPVWVLSAMSQVVNLTYATVASDLPLTIASVGSLAASLVVVAACWVCASPFERRHAVAVGLTVSSASAAAVVGGWETLLAVAMVVNAAVSCVLHLRHMLNAESVSGVSSPAWTANMGAAVLWVWWGATTGQPAFVASNVGWFGTSVVTLTVLWQRRSRPTVPAAVVPAVAVG